MNGVGVSIRISSIRVSDSVVVVVVMVHSKIFHSSTGCGSCCNIRRVSIRIGYVVAVSSIRSICR